MIIGRHVVRHSLILLQMYITAPRIRLCRITTRKNFMLTKIRLIIKCCTLRRLVRMKIAVRKNHYILLR